MNNTVYYDYSEEFPLSNLAQGYIDFYNDGGNIQNISDLNPEAVMAILAYIQM